MFCYRDTTFCASKDCKNKCGRKWTAKTQEEYDAFCSRTKFNMPVAWANFCEKKNEHK